jgi:hypothetical protein
MSPSKPGSCEKCGKDSKQLNSLFGKQICSKCHYEFYKIIKRLIQKNPQMHQEFKQWFFEMEMEG